MNKGKSIEYRDMHEASMETGDYDEPLNSPDNEASQPMQEKDISDLESVTTASPLHSNQSSPRHSMPLLQSQSPANSRPETPHHPLLDINCCETPLLSSQLNIVHADSRFVSIQDITDMETPFLKVPPLPESPTELLLPPMLVMTGNASATQDCNTDIHSCLSSASYLNSTLSTPLAHKKIRSTDSDTGTDLLPVCRICQLPGDKEDFLFSPCRCSGTMMFVHYLCLLKWIEISTRKTKKTPKCELCHFQYVRHKRFKLHHWRMPRVSSQDKCLHTVFFVNLVVMVTCAVATILCFLSDRGQLQELSRNILKPGGQDKQIDLTTEEIITLTCGIMFFVSFFVAMTVEIKAKHTVYRLFLRFISHNTEWQIEPYQRSRDLELNGGGPQSPKSDDCV